jgi:hypothetical protein
MDISNADDDDAVLAMSVQLLYPRLIASILG